MILLKLSYSDANWELKDLEFSGVNLIVAKNGTGKSRSLVVLDWIIKIITQQQGFLDSGGIWEIEFLNSKKEVTKYSFSKSFDDKRLLSFVDKEMLIIGDNEVLRRDKTVATIKNILTGDMELVYPPAGKLVLHTNRDLKKYPYLEEITNWCENSYGFQFANVISSSLLNRTFSRLLNPVDDIPDLFHHLNKDSQQSIITQFNGIGYSVTEITSEQNGEDVSLYLKENSIEKILPRWQLAQGMYRALSIIIFIEYLISIKKPAMIAIDDLCEGLDYDRAKKLGHLVFEKCLNSDIQLIATSNDVFLMDVVDIKYWNILRRSGNEVTALNYRNNKKAFDDFRFTGLSNFDFFASDFLNQELRD